MARTKMMLTLAAALTALLLTGCAEEKQAEVTNSGEPAEVVDDGATEAAADGAGDQDEASEQATAALGDTVAVGTWEVRVTKVVRNADQVLTKANQFNDKPSGQYVLVTYQATYGGDERTGDAMFDLSWSLTTNDAQVHETAAAVTPADSESWPTEARKGGSIRGQVVFDVAAAKLPGSLLTVETLDESFDTVFADFAVG